MRPVTYLCLLVSNSPASGVSRLSCVRSASGDESCTGGTTATVTTIWYGTDRLPATVAFSTPGVTSNRFTACCCT